MEITRRFERRIPGSNPGRAAYYTATGRRRMPRKARAKTKRSVAKSGHRARLGAGRSQVQILPFRLRRAFGCGVIWEPAWPGTTRLSVRIRSPGLVGQASSLPSVCRQAGSLPHIQPGRSTVQDAVLIRRRRRFDSFSGYSHFAVGLRRIAVQGQSNNSKRLAYGACRAWPER